VVPVAPVHDVAQALENPFVAGEGRTATYAGPDGTELLRMLAAPVTVAGADQPRRAGPALGADTDDILRGLGLDEAEITGMREKGVI